MIKRIPLVFTFSLVSALLCTMHSQSLDQQTYYNWFDSQVGVENTGLFNGTRYRELYRIKDGKHKFYQSPEYLTGHLIYDGQPYYDVSLKYDLFEDDLIVEVSTQSGRSIIKLIKDLIDSFVIEESEFRHVRDLEYYKSKERVNGFFEILAEGNNLLLYKQHRKLRKKVLEKKIVLNEFRIDNQYFIQHNDTFYPVTGKNDLIKIFPDRKKQINDYFSGNKFLMKSNYDLFMIQIAERIDRVSSEKRAADE